ncbi:MAG: glycosyltransferase [Chitinispirillaceae bacterium]
MRVGFVFPKKQKCGISIYSARYVEALKKIPVEVMEIDMTDLYSDNVNGNRLVENLDVLHVQYEASFFLRNRKDLFRQLFYALEKPLIVSLHEVYEKNPFVFPRENIRPPFQFVKRKIYDWRHPLQTMYRRHVRSQFFADRVLVHHEYHKGILEAGGVESSRIKVIGHPVKAVATGETDGVKAGKPVRLGCAGFINPQYDFDLLFRSLEKLSADWKFTWVGGTRNRSQEKLLSDLNSRIRLMNWEHRFSFSGWMDENRFNASLGNLDLALCLFSSRSSSGSMTDLLGSGVPIIATDLEMTREIARDCRSVALVERDSGEVSRAVDDFCKDSVDRSRIQGDIRQYCELNSYEKKALEMLQVYREVLS